MAALKKSSVFYKKLPIRNSIRNSQIVNRLRNSDLCHLSGSKLTKKLFISVKNFYFGKFLLRFLFVHALYFSDAGTAGSQKVRY